MSVEKMVAKEGVGAVQRGVRDGMRLVKKAWSMMDAATEKTKPTEFLSKDAINSMRGDT